MATELFDFEDVYDEEIAPLMAKIIEICHSHKLPMVASFHYALRDEDDESLCTTTLTYEERGPQRTINAAHKALFTPNTRMYRITETNATGEVVAQTMIADLTGETK